MILKHLLKQKYAYERFYSTIDKRFNSKDPVVGTIYEPERVNSYIYAGDNPLIYSDRDGRSFTCDVVNSRIFNKARDLCDTISKVINCFEKTIEPIVKTISKAYECYNKVFDKIPTPVKFGIGLAGATIACLTGVGTAVVAGALVKSAISGAAFGAAMYGISAIATGEFNGKDLVSSMINGAADMVMFTGATLGIKGAIECATRNAGKIQKAMLANETGESNALGKLDEFVERKAGKLETGYGKSSGSSVYQGESDTHIIGTSYDINKLKQTQPYIYEGEVNQLVEVIKEKGPNAVPPIRVRVHKGIAYIVDGHHRYNAFLKLGYERVPIKYLHGSDLGKNMSDGTYVRTLQELLDGASLVED